MKIRNKVFIIMVTVLLLLISVACSITHKYLKSNLKKTEISYINSKLEINHNIIRDSLDSLTILNKDWSAWDATLNFVKFKDENYIKNNLNDSTFNDLKINLFIVLDKLNNIKYIKYYNNLSPNSTNKPP
ncbi:PAS/PAC sensor-containing diguanylate cyclase, partial [Clostridium tetanomorphum DSM 665]